MREQRSLFYCQWLSTIFIVLSLQMSGFCQSTITVIDDTNQSLVGVYVSYADVQTTTDLNGKFTLQGSIGDDVIFSLEYVGFKDLQISFSDIQKNNNTIQLLADNQILEEVIIIGRTNARPIDLPYQIERITSEEIYKSSAQNSADAIGLNAGAYIQKSQLGGGSPTLRGFEANKILLVVDGVRMNNAIYRNGHLQNAITIDPSILEQAEVIFGAGSLLYGSEALGGVIHFRTKSPLLNFDESVSSKHKISAFARFNSSNNEKRFHIDHVFSKRKFGVLTSVTYSDFGDLRTGSNRSSEYPEFGLRPNFVEVINGEDVVQVNDNPNVQVGTGFSQYDILQKWAFEVSDDIKTELNLQYSNSSNIPRYDNLAENRNGNLRFAEWYYGPQERILISPKISFSKKNLLFDNAQLIGSFQKIAEDRISRNLNDSVEENQNEDVKVFGVTLDFNKRLHQNHKLVYGLDYHYNEVVSTAFSRTNPYSSNPTLASDILTRYPSGGSQLKNFGVYIQHNWQNRDSSIIWINGLRWTNQTVDILYDRSDVIEWPEFFYGGIVNKNSALVGISGLNIVKGDFTFKASSGTSFRSPNVDDLAKIRVNGDEITVPNTNLDSEKVWNNELTIEYRKKAFAIGLTGYYTHISDAIIREDFLLPDGSSIYINRGDTLNVTGNVNANSGTIKGVSLQLEVDLTSKLTFNSNLNIQRGEARNNEGEKSPLGHIPPTFGRSTLGYNTENFDVQLNWQFNLWKRLEDFGGSVDNPELATVDGSPAWHNIGINAQFHMNESITLSGGIDNIFDVHYRPFASGLSAPGRHVVFAIRYDVQ